MSLNDVDGFYDYFQSCYDILTTESRDTAFIIAGDFNPTSNGFKSRFLNIHCNLKQVVKEATRNTSILDLIFTNVNYFYKVPEVIRIRIRIRIRIYSYYITAKAELRNSYKIL